MITHSFQTFLTLLLGPLSSASKRVTRSLAASLSEADPNDNHQSNENVGESFLLITKNMADTAKLRRMGMYDFFVPLLDGEVRRVLLYVHKKTGSRVWKTLKHLEKTNDLPRHYTATLRFIGDRSDRSYICIEARLSKVPDIAFDKFVYDMEFCRKMFLERSNPVFLCAEVYCEGSRETLMLDLDLVDLVVDAKVLVFQKPSSSVTSFGTIYKSIRKRNRNLATAGLLDEYYADGQQTMEIIDAWKSVKNQDSTQAKAKVIRRRSIEQEKDKAEQGGDNVDAFTATTEAILSDCLENGRDGFRFMNHPQIDKRQMQELVDVCKEFLPGRFAQTKGRVRKDVDPFWWDVRAWFKLCAELHIQKARCLPSFGLIFAMGGSRRHRQYVRFKATQGPGLCSLPKHC